MRTLKTSLRALGVLGALGLVHCGGETTYGEALEPPSESEKSDERGSDRAPSDDRSDGAPGADEVSGGMDSEPEESQGGEVVDGAGGAPAGSDGDGDSGSAESGGGGLYPVPGCNTVPGDRVVRLVPQEYDSIQAAIDAADYGDTVKVGPGTYDENLRLRSGVLLLGAGAGKTILDGGGRGENLIDASYTQDSVVRGFTLRNVGQREGCADPDDPGRCSGDWYTAAVYIDGHLEEGCATSIEITENSIEDNEIAVLLYYQPSGRAHVHDNRFINNRVGLVANHHGDGEGEVTHNLFVGSEQALLLQASYLDITHNIIAGVGTVLSQENIQRGDLACNLLYDYADIGNRLVLGEDNNVALVEDPFVPGGLTLSPGAPTPGCSTDTDEPIVPGPREELFVDP